MQREPGRQEPEDGAGDERDGDRPGLVGEPPHVQHHPGAGRDEEQGEVLEEAAGGVPQFGGWPFRAENQIDKQQGHADDRAGDGQMQGDPQGFAGELEGEQEG